MGRKRDRSGKPVSFLKMRTNSWKKSGVSEFSFRSKPILFKPNETKRIIMVGATVPAAKGKSGSIVIDKLTSSKPRFFKGVPFKLDFTVPRDRSSVFEDFLSARLKTSIVPVGPSQGALDIAGVSGRAQFKVLLESTSTAPIAPIAISLKNLKFRFSIKGMVDPSQVGVGIFYTGNITPKSKLYSHFNAKMLTMVVDGPDALKLAAGKEKKFLVKTAIRSEAAKGGTYTITLEQITADYVDAKGTKLAVYEALKEPVSSGMYSVVSIPENDLIQAGSWTASSTAAKVETNYHELGKNKYQTIETGKAGRVWFTWAFPGSECSASVYKVKDGKPDYKNEVKDYSWTEEQVLFPNFGSAEINPMAVSQFYELNCFSGGNKDYRGILVSVASPSVSQGAVKGSQAQGVSVQQANPSLTLRTSDNKTEYVLGEKVPLYWELANVASSDIKSCTVSSNGDYRNDRERGDDPVISKFSGEYKEGTRIVVIGEPIRPRVSYTVTCKLKTQSAPLSVSVQISVKPSQKPIVRELLILQPNGNSPETKQELEYVAAMTTQMGVDCTKSGGVGLADLDKDRQRQEKWPLFWQDAMYINSKFAFIPRKNGTCILEGITRGARGEIQDKITQVIEFTVYGTPPPDPLQVVVSNVIKPAQEGSAPGNAQTLSYTVGGYYHYQTGDLNVVDILKGDANCIKAFADIKISDAGNDATKKNVTLYFKPGKTAKCQYEVRNRATGSATSINFDLKVVPPYPPVIVSAYVLKPYGQDRGDIQYIDFIVGGEEWKVTGGDECGPALFDPRLEPYRTQDVSEGSIDKDPSLDFYTHVSRAIRAEKSIKCTIEAKTKNSTTKMDVYVDYVQPGKPAPVRVYLDLDRKRLPTVGLQPSILDNPSSMLQGANSLAQVDPLSRTSQWTYPQEIGPLSGTNQWTFPQEIGP